MAALQRSTISFRREGSSGTVWDDRKLIAEMDEQGKRDLSGLRHSYSIGCPSIVASSSGAADADPVYIRSRSAPAVKIMLIPKSVGRKFKGVLAKPKSKLSEAEPERRG
ncbi:unnamed protein product [Coffea canephora]|uniref:Uncharacterized protein n=1 Tax=Coffea canephora TaxID=49390 RepID=A0A068UZ13_COFCA|nr:unnamed protein product [Coffea canephora]